MKGRKLKGSWVLVRIRGRRGLLFKHHDRFASSKDLALVAPRSVLSGQIALAEWTADGKLRQPAFLGLRTDKAPAECRWSERER